LLQAPLSRFGDTAANTGVLSYMDNTNLATLPVAVKTAAASSVAALWRVALMPIDTVKTVLQGLVVVFVLFLFCRGSNPFSHFLPSRR